MAQYEVTLRDYWRILRRRKGIVLFTAFLLGLFSFLIASVWKPVPMYQATSKVQINLHQNLTGLYLQTIAYNTGDAIETQQKILTSHPVLKRTAEELGMLSWARTAEDTAVVLTDMTRRIATSQEGFTNIVALSATDPDPVRARDLANALARTYREYDHELKNQQAVNHRKFVEGQREQARQALVEAEEKVRSYREESELISLESQASVNLQGITTSEREVQRLEQDLDAVGAMVREMEANQVLSEQTLQGAQVRRVGETFMALSRQLGDFKLQRDALLVQYTQDHPSVRQVQVKIDQLGRDLKGELTQRRASLQRDLAAEAGRLKDLRLQYSQLPSRGLELSRLQREVALRQQVVSVLEENYQEALIREADKVEEVTVLEWALTPAEPTNPHHPLQRAALGVLLGLVLGVVFAVVAETLDTSIGTIEDVQEYTGTQVVGIIPFIDVDDVRASLQRRGVDVSDERTVQRKAQLVAYFDPQSTLAETYRTLRTNIEFVTVEKGVRCLMVTSSMHYEGKSTTIANLSMTMAQLGKRTLLVDCDLRKPSTARLFGLDKEPGVTEVVVGNYQWRDVVRTVTDIVTGGMGMEDILQTQGISNLHIITSGSIPPNPAELLNSRRMAEFLAEIRDAYDVVLIDTPPVLHVTDAAILGKKVDGALMVYKAGDVARTSLKRSTTLLRSVGIELLGVVLNGIRADMSSDYQDLGYNAYYAYGSELGAAERTLGQRVHDWTRRWQRRLGLGGEEPTRREQTWTAARDAGAGVVLAQDRARPLRKAAAYLTLAIVLVGLLWQTGGLSWATRRADGDEGGGPAVSAVVEPMVATGIQIARETSMPTQLEAEGEASVPSVQAEAEGETAGAAAASGRAPTVARPVVAEPAVGGISAEDEGAPSSPMATAPVARLPPKAAPPTDDGHRIVLCDRAYSVRVASYPPRSRWATKALRNLRELGEAAYLSPVEVRGEPYDRLLIGRFATWDEAYAHARELKAAGDLVEFTVLRLPYSVSAADGAEAMWGDYAADPREGLLGAFATQQEAQVLLDRESALRSSQGAPGR